MFIVNIIVHPILFIVISLSTLFYVHPLLNCYLFTLVNPLHSIHHGVTCVSFKFQGALRAYNHTLQNDVLGLVLMLHVLLFFVGCSFLSLLSGGSCLTLLSSIGIHPGFPYISIPPGKLVPGGSSAMSNRSRSIWTVLQNVVYRWCWSWRGVIFNSLQIHLLHPAPC